MATVPAPTCTAFLDGRRIAAGDAGAISAALATLPVEDRARAIALDDATGRTVEAWSGDAPAAAAPLPKRGRGRPKLGVAAR